MTNLYRTHCLTCGTERGILSCCPNPTCGQSMDQACERVVDQLMHRALEHITTRQVGDSQSRVKELEQALAEAQANYQFMVDRAANEKLDGYRELGAKLAAAENRIDVLTRQLPWAKPWTKTAPLNESNDVNPWNLLAELVKAIDAGKTNEVDEKLYDTVEAAYEIVPVDSIEAELEAARVALERRK